MKLKVVVHDTKEGGFWAEVPAVPGCTAKGETIEELKRNIQSAIDSSFSVKADQTEAGASDKSGRIAQ
jgi:predicted RNase H-like HicB family nuclease